MELARLSRRARRGASGRLRRAAEKALETRYGVSTSEHVYHEDLGLPTENRVWHDPSNWVALDKALGRLGVTGTDVFVDHGSGLGRALLVASKLPFRRVIGVELSEDLNRRAAANLQASRVRRRAADIEIVTSDALDWPVPRDLTVAYFYCPFTGAVFREVVERLLASLDEHPRPLRLVYNYPFEHNLLLRTGRVRPLQVVRGQWPVRSTAADVIVTYLALPKDESLAAEYMARFPQRLRGSEEWVGEYDPGFVLEKPQRLGGIVADRPTAG